MSEAFLVVVDMQELFRDAASPWNIGGFATLEEPIGRLSEAFGDRVIHTRFVVPAERPGSWGPYYETFDAVTDPANAGWFELAEPYRSRAAAVVERPTFDAWTSAVRPRLDEEPTLVLCGVATDCCVISTALAAADGGAFVRVVEDACAGSSPSSHEAAVTVLRGYAPQVTLSTVEDERRAVSRLSP